MGKYKIGVYAICKNEAKFVDRWVDSMQEADIIVVCDTGSDDDTIERLKERNVSVYEIKVDPWRFDVPRNIAMDYLPEDIDICVSTDLDEVFEPGWRDKVEAIWKPETTRLRYSYTSFYHPDGTPGVTYLYEKIHRRFGFRWFKPVHELLEYTGDQPDCYAIDTAIHLMHHPDAGKPRTQYLRLLELSMQEYPEDDRNMHYLGREYMFRGMYPEAIETLQKHLGMQGANWRDERCASMRFIAYCYQQLNNESEEKVWLFRALGEAPNRREPYLAVAKYAYAHQNWSLVYAMTKEALCIKDRPGFYLDDPDCWNHTFYDLGGISCYYLGLYRQSCEYTKQAIEMAPHDQRLRNNLKFAQEQLEKSMGILNKANQEQANQERANQEQANQEQTDQEPINQEQTDQEQANQQQANQEQVNQESTNHEDTTEKQSDHKTAIIILTYHNLDYTKKCINSIRAFTDPATYELIIVDNGSTDGTREWLIEQPDLKYLFNDKNEGFPKGCNLGAELAQADSDLLFLNNDTEVCENWLHNLNAALYADDINGAVGAATSYDFYGATDEDGVIEFTDESIARIQNFAKQNNISDSHRWEYRNQLIGFCMLIKRKVWNLTGPLDERFTPGTYEDTDISVRIQELGYRLVFCRDCYVHHYGSRSFHHKTDEYQQLLNTNSLKFYEKWGFRAEEMRLSKYYLIRMMEESDRPMNILDLHCGFGGTLLAIKTQYPQAVLYGIEEEKYKKVVSAFATFSTKLEFPLEIEPHAMDYIFIDDELEHVSDPGAYLKKLRFYLKKDGCVIGVIHNQAYYKKFKTMKEQSWLTQDREITVTGGALQLGIDEIAPFCESCGYKNTFLFHWSQEPEGEDRQLVEEMCKIGGAHREILYKTERITYKFRNDTDCIDYKE